jgi:hypothetical protein
MVPESPVLKPQNKGLMRFSARHVLYVTYVSLTAFNPARASSVLAWMLRELSRSIKMS